MKRTGLALMALCMTLLNSVSRADTVRVSPENLRAHVEKLCGTSKPRNYKNLEALNEAADYIFKTWASMGFKPEYQTFEAGGSTYKNVIIAMGPASAPHVVIGAHYDVAGSGPGADDNASGVAGVLELARLLKPIEASLKHRVELVAFTLEEPPFFSTKEMGSAIHAEALKKENVKVKLMMSLEMIGYYTDKEKSQEYPVSALKAIYPTVGNFIGVVGELSSPLIVRKIKTLIRDNSNIAVESITAPASLPGVGLSDHANYWKIGVPAVMITDTAFFRNSNYHEATDKPDTLNYEKMAEVVKGVFAVAKDF